MHLKNIPVSYFSKLKNLDDSLFREFVKAYMDLRAQKKDDEDTKRLLKDIISKYMEAQRHLIKLNDELTSKQKHINQDLKGAAEIQKSLLPKELPLIRNLKIAWKFEPCDFIGGDIFHVFRLDEDHIAFYILDVSGHGVPSAMVTVSVSQMLQSYTHNITKNKIDHPPYYELVSPKDIMRILDNEFPITRFDMFFTMVYLVFNHRTGGFVYCNAGHPSPVLLHRDGKMELLDKGGSIIGFNGGLTFEQEEKLMSDGDKLLFYTDGVIEYRDREENTYDQERLCFIIEQNRDKPIAEIINFVYEDMMTFGKNSRLEDDVTLMGFEFTLKQ